jgi:hypothetical protein
MVAVQKNDHVHGRTQHGESRQARAPIAGDWFGHDPRTALPRNRGRPVGGTVIHDDDLARKRSWNLG